MKAADIWMPLYIGDYLSATSRLTTAQHGAYLLLIMDYWRNGPIPDNDQALAQITRMSVDDWRVIGPQITHFFRVDAGVWRHTRIDKELNKANNKVKVRSQSGLMGASKKWGTDSERDGKANRSERLANARRFARHLPDEWQALKSVCGTQCLLCGVESDLVKDHIVPIYQGGSDGIENIQPLCRSCNASKGSDTTDHRPKNWHDALAKRLANAWQNASQTPGPSPSPSPSTLKPCTEANASVQCGLFESDSSKPTPPHADPQHQTPRAPACSKRRANPAGSSPSAAAWTAYAAAYGLRYGVNPVRNARVNAQLSQLVARLGTDAAGHIAAWYVGHNGALYVRGKHPVGLLVRDCEGLHTEWARGAQVTETDARLVDRKQTSLNTWAPLLREAEEAEAARTAMQEGSIGDQKETAHAQR